MLISVNSNLSTLKELVVGNSTNAPPAGNATQSPKAGPFEFWVGSKNPEATTTNGWSSRFNVESGALYEAKVVVT